MSDCDQRKVVQQQGRLRRFTMKISALLLLVILFSSLTLTQTRGKIFWIFNNYLFYWDTIHKLMCNANSSICPLITIAASFHDQPLPPPLHAQGLLLLYWSTDDHWPCLLTTTNHDTPWKFNHLHKKTAGHKKDVCAWGRKHSCDIERGCSYGCHDGHCWRQCNG